MARLEVVPFPSVTRSRATTVTGIRRVRQAVTMNENAIRWNRMAFVLEKV
jgi:hypothetical protein